MKKLSYYLYETFFKAISNKTRFEVLRLLEKGSKNVSEICEALKFEQSRVSHNLKKLEKCGFIKSKCKGKQRIYSLKSKYTITIMNAIDKYINRNLKRLKVCL